MDAYKPKVDRTYWIVVGFHTTRNRHPFQHKTFGSACKEAERLAALKPGEFFNVFKLKMVYVQKKEAKADARV